MFKLSKTIQSNFPGEKNVPYMQNIITYILRDYSLGAQRNVPLKKKVFGWQKENLSPQYQTR